MGALLAIAQAACSSSSAPGTDAAAKDARRLFLDAGDASDETPPDLGPLPDRDSGTDDSSAPPPRDATPSGEDADLEQPDTGTPGPPSEAEALDEQINDDFASGEALPIDSSITGAIGVPQMGIYDQDVFRFDAVAGEVLQVSLTPRAGSLLQPALLVADENETYLRSADAAGAVETVTRQFYVVASGSLAVLVNDYRNILDPPEISGGAAFTYQLELRRVAVAPARVTLPIARAAGAIDAAGALVIHEFTAVAGEQVSAQVFASRLATPSDVDTILILEDRTGPAPVVAVLHDDLDVDNGVTDSELTATLGAGTHRLILDYYAIYGPNRTYELAVQTSAGPPPPTGGLILNEVDYENPGTDNQEFVEIHNSGNQAVALAGLALIFINGSNDSEYRRVDLDTAGPTLAAGNYLVVAMNGVTIEPAALVIRDAATAQNGPDGVLLFDTASNTVLDALSYEGEITAANITGATGTFNLVEGTASALADSDATQGTLARCPNATDTDDADHDWAPATMPTPGGANDCP